jgi:trans-aconitate methyltransferase
MRLTDAIDMLRDSNVTALGPTTWADLGCGTGTFTIALAALLAPGSAVHAMDRNGAALTKIPATYDLVRITTHRHDFTQQPWPFGPVDGVLLANSLHYVEDQTAFIRACESQMTRRRFIVVEYDTSQSSPWVPFPLGLTTLTTLFAGLGYSSVRALARRPSAYRRAALYSAAIETSSRREATKPV